MANFVWDKPSPGGSSNQTSFQANMYSNPQMGAFGKSFDQPAGPYGGQSGGGFGQAGVPQGSYGGTPYGQPSGLSPAMADWYGSFTSPGSLWQDLGENQPGHYGRSGQFNPATGATEYRDNTTFYDNFRGPSGAASWVDPQTGRTYINAKGMMGMFDASGSGSGGYDPYQMTDFQGGQINAPGAYGGGDWDVSKNVVNVHDVIESYRPTMEAEIGAGFAQAGNRLGQSGFAMSTPYATALGDVERLARAQMNQRGLEYQYDAGKFDAGNQMAAMMAENAEKYGGWQQAGNWDMAAQQGNVSNATQQWMLENQLGFQGNQAQNLYNQQDQMNQQQFLASLLGGLI